MLFSRFFLKQWSLLSLFNLSLAFGLSLGWSLPYVQAATALVAIEGTNLETQKQVKYSLNQASKGTVLIFLSSRCPCSASHEERLKELYHEFSPLGFQFIGVHANQDEPESEAKIHFKNVNFPFPIIQDPAAKLANFVGALKTPHAYVVSPKSEILYQGGVDDSHDARAAKKYYLKMALTQIQKGKSPDPAEMRALGCTIKR